MAPRKKQRQASSSAEYDPLRFWSTKASNNYMELLSKNLVKERGIDLSSAGDTPLLLAVQARGWGELIKTPADAIVPLIREFYANLKECHENFQVLVRGKMVPFDSVTINDLYHIPDIENDEYTKYLRENLDYDEVIRTVCKAGAKWRTNRGEAVNFPRSDLVDIAKEWFNFIAARFIPSTHLTDVTKERAALVFAIITGKSINVGRVIQASILNSVQGATTSGLRHPSLITDLCQRAGVSWEKDEEILKPQIPIVAYGRVQRPVVNHGEDMPLEGSSRSAHPSRNRPLPSCTSQLNLNDRVTLIEQRIRNQRRQFDAFHKKFNDYVAYSIDFNSSLVRMFANAVQFPQPPNFQTHPSDNDEDDNRRRSSKKSQSFSSQANLHGMGCKTPPLE